MRIPSDLLKRYGKQFVRVSLKTSDGLLAAKKTESLALSYLAQFKALQDDPQLTPVEVTVNARELAERSGTLTTFIEYVVDPAREKYVAGDEEVVVGTELLKGCLGFFFQNIPDSMRYMYC
jgi:hypothetical protein